MKSSEHAWRYTLNLTRTLRFRPDPAALGTHARAALDQLNRDGIVTMPFDQLIPSPGVYEELVEAVGNVEKERAPLLEEQRRLADTAETTKRKAYVYHHVEHPRMYETHKLGIIEPPADVFARVALQSPLVQVVNEYFRMYTRLRYYDVWHSFPTRGPEMASQQWHRDPEDRCIVKMFVYLGDVGLEEGPFTYAPGTHYKGHLRATRPELFADRRGMYQNRVSDAEMETFVPEETWVRAIGPAGTTVIADTSGYHKGGSRSRDRLLYMCMFSSGVSGIFAQRPS